MKPSLLGGQNSKRSLKRSRFICLHHLCSRRLGEEYLSDFVAAEDKVIGAVLTQKTEGKVYIITYLSRRLIDAEIRYTFIEKLCLSLYYACTKLRHYHYIVVCQTDVIKHMLQKPILSGRIGKWAYSLVEYDLVCEPLKSIRGQIVADIIVEHRINDN